MKTLTVDKVGWKKLQTILDVLIKAINRSTPVKGDGISLSETDNGIIISIDLKSDDLRQQELAAVAGPWNIRLYDVSFMPATIVDPTTCQQTFVQVLIQDPGGWTDIDSDLQLNAANHPDTNPFG